MKLTRTFAASLPLLAVLACSGPSGTSATATNQPTSTNAACAFGITPSTANFASGGGSQVVNVSATPAGCTPSTWSASTSNAALSVSPTSGSGNGTVTVSASANAAAGQQTLTATIAGQTFSAIVGAVACTYKFSANAPDQNGNAWIVPADGSERGVTVTVSPNDGSCAPWKAASNADWITVSPASGTTSTTVRVDYSANPTAGARTGAVSFLRPDCTAADCGVTVALNQSGRSGSTPPAGQSGLSAKCGGTFHPGEYAGLACSVFVQERPNNPVQGVYTDRSLFGGPAQLGVPKCPACGGPPWTFDLDLPIPGNMAPGVKTFPVWAIYADGSRADTTGSITVAGPPSQLTISAKCFGPVHPGQDVTCALLVADVNYPQDTRFEAWADLQVFGGPAEVEAVPINGGSPPYTIQVHVPATMTPGVKTFAVWARNVYAPNTHEVTGTASIEIVAP